MQNKCQEEQKEKPIMLLFRKMLWQHIQWWNGKWFGETCEGTIRKVSWPYFP